MSYSPAVPINNKCMLVGPHIKSIRVAIDVAYRAAKLHSTYLHHSIPGRSLFQSGMSQFWTPTVQYACFLGLGSQEVDKLFAYWNHFKSDMICSGVVLHCNITTAYRALAWQPSTFAHVLLRALHWLWQAYCASLLPCCTTKIPNVFGWSHYCHGQPWPATNIYTYVDVSWTKRVGCRIASNRNFRNRLS